MTFLAETRGTNPPEAAAALSAPANKLPNTARPARHQIKDKLLADALAIRLKWKSLIDAAGIAWPKVPPEDLLRVDGDFHRLAGLVQLRHQLDRQEADRQVQDFLSTHYAVA